jgi:hypothetical protein
MPDLIARCLDCFSVKLFSQYSARLIAHKKVAATLSYNLLNLLNIFKAPIEFRSKNFQR